MPKEDTPQKPERGGNITSLSQSIERKKQRTKTDYVELAKERNARVILHNTPDTYPLTDLARYADQGIRRLRNRIMISLAPKDALPLLDEYNEALIKLHTVIEKICSVTDVKYRQPRTLVQLIGEARPEETETDENSKGKVSGAAGKGKEKRQQ